jgi:Flp pilus assembly protein TadG
MKIASIKSRRRRRRDTVQSSRGQVMAEFALVLTPCLMLIFGIINFALALYCYDFVCYSAQEAARYATVHGATGSPVVAASDVQSYVNTLVAGVLNTSHVSVSTTWSPNNSPGGVVTVTVSYSYPPLTSLVSSVTIPLTRTAAMVITQ